VKKERKTEVRFPYSKIYELPFPSLASVVCVLRVEVVFNLIIHLKNYLRSNYDEVGTNPSKISSSIESQPPQK